MKHEICQLWRMKIHKDTFSIEVQDFEYRMADQQDRHLVDNTWWKVATLIPNEEVPRGMSHRRFYVYATLVGDPQEMYFKSDGKNGTGTFKVDRQLNICLFLLAKAMTTSSTLIMM